MNRALHLAALAVAFVVVVMGAYVRLSDAGLGCPDWPLCYGRPLPGEIADSDALARAWKEMGHRYLAGALGVLILLIAVSAWRRGRSKWAPTALLALVIFQATLGAWTVTMLLKPAIVTAHLLGGMATLGLITWLTLEHSRFTPAGAASALRAPAAIALAALGVQITLGGWVSSNYAALACPDLPLCLGHVVPPMDFHNAFGGGLVSAQALTAIHWTHRVFALLLLGVGGWAAYRTFRFWRGLALALGALLVLQFSLGVANVAVSRPLPLAAAHNAGAALLVAVLVVLNFFAFRGLRPPS
jgi:heme a synthase